MNEFFKAIISNGDTIIVAVVAIILGIERFTVGGSKIRKEINEEYKERNKQLEDKVTVCLEEIHKTNLEVARLTGIIQEKDKNIDALTKIIQGRNPEMIELLKEIKEGNKIIQDFIKTTHKELEYQTNILEKSQAREEIIDQASKEHVGAVLRTPENGENIKK